MNITANIHCGADVPTVEVKIFDKYDPQFVIVAFGETGNLGERPPANFSFFLDSIESVRKLNDALTVAIRDAKVV